MKKDYRSEKTVRAYVIRKGGEFFKAYPNPIPAQDLDEYWQFQSTNKKGMQRTEIQIKKFVFLCWLPVPEKSGGWKQPGTALGEIAYSGEVK